MTTTIAGTTVEDPDVGYEGVQVEHVDLSVMHELADGSSVIDHVNEKERYKLRWTGLTAAELTTLEGTLTKGTSLAVRLPHQAGTSNCFIVPNSYKKRYIQDGSGAWRYQVDITFVQVS